MVGYDEDKQDLYVLSKGKTLYVVFLHSSYDLLPLCLPFVLISFRLCYIQSVLPRYYLVSLLVLTRLARYPPFVLSSFHFGFHYARTSSLPHPSPPVTTLSPP
jgi:hypothetical protein